MSFVFSPQTVLAELDFQIDILENQITDLFDDLPIAIEERDIIARDPNRPFSEPLQQRLVSLALKVARIQKEISGKQNEIIELLDQKRIVELEITTRETLPPDTSLPIPPVGVTPGIQDTLQNIIDLLNRPVAPTQPQVTVQQELPLKELALIGGAVLLLA